MPYLRQLPEILTGLVGKVTSSSTSSEASPLSYISPGVFRVVATCMNRSFLDSLDQSNFGLKLFSATCYNLPSSPPVSIVVIITPRFASSHMCDQMSSPQGDLTRGTESRSRCRRYTHFSIVETCRLLLSPLTSAQYQADGMTGVDRPGECPRFDSEERSFICN